MRISLILTRGDAPQRRSAGAIGRLVALGAGLVALAASSCGAQVGPGGDDRPLIVASFYPLAEASARVGGDAVRVENLTPAGTEPHDLELAPRQVETIGSADLLVFVGGGFQPAVDAAAADAPRTLDVIEGLPTRAGEPDVSTGAEGNPEDPHVWLDPTLQAEIADRIASALSELAPAERATFDANAGSYADELAALDAEYREGLERCDRRTLVTSHAAFGYLADRYDLRQEAIAGATGEGEPAPDRLAELVRLVRAEGVTTVFTEPLAPPELAETLAREAGVRTAVLDPLEGLTPEQEAAGEDYVSVMRANLDALREGLGCA